MTCSHASMHAQRRSLFVLSCQGCTQDSSTLVVHTAVRWCRTLEVRLVNSCGTCAWLLSQNDAHLAGQDLQGSCPLACVFVLL